MLSIGRRPCVAGVSRPRRLASGLGCSDEHSCVVGNVKLVCLLISPLGDSLYTLDSPPAVPVRKILGKVSLQGGSLRCSERSAAVEVDVRESSREFVARSPEGAPWQDGDVGFV